MIFYARTTSAGHAAKLIKLISRRIFFQNGKKIDNIFSVLKCKQQTFNGLTGVFFCCQTMSLINLLLIVNI